MPKIPRSKAMPLLDKLHESKLSMSPWERARITEWAKTKADGGYFSQKQLDIIERIYLEYMT